MSNDAMKLLDRGDIVVLFRNPLGSYTAVSVKEGTDAEDILRDSLDAVLTNEEDEDAMPGVTLTDDFTPAQALYRLTEKATTGRIV